ncbi:MAG: [FeFe] hydrogenase H-cluster radical SAM maturase HydE [Ignavibacteriaceae bacterium]
MFISDYFMNAVTSILNKNYLNKDDIIFLLKLNEEKGIGKLFCKADQIRQKYCGNDVHLRGIIELSNYCEQDCLYCGLRRGNKSLKRYRMSKNEILDTARRIYDAGLKTIVLQSGEDSWFSKADLSEIISSIKNEMDVAITLSLGERTADEYEEWRKAGADRYLLKHETANPRLYSMYHQRQKLTDRIKNLLQLKSLGYQVGSGNLIGLPHQTTEDIADDILICKELNVDMASFSPFIPSPNTPYENKNAADPHLVFKTIAVTRIVLKDVHLPVTTALSTLYPSAREKALKVGANVIMPNFTPEPYRNYYLIYPNKNRIESVPDEMISSVKKLVNSLGRNIGVTRGDSLKQNRISV